MHPALLGPLDVIFYFILLIFAISYVIARITEGFEKRREKWRRLRWSKAETTPLWKRLGMTRAQIEAYWRQCRIERGEMLPPPNPADAAAAAGILLGKETP